MRPKIFLTLALLLLAPFASAQELAFDVLSYNVHMVPKPCDCHNDYKTPLIAAHPDVRGHDAVVFVETMSVEHRELLTDLLRDEYPFHSMVPGRDPAGPVTDGGVIILSKWPIEAQSAIVFSDCNGTLNPDAPDCFAQKGVVWARIVKEGHRINVFGTHFDAGFDDDDFSVRDIDITEMSRFILNRVPIDEPAIMAGDYNIDKQGTATMRNQYLSLTTKMNAELPVNVGSVGSTNAKGEWIDYTFFSKTYRQPVSSNVRVLTPKDGAGGDLSDHYAVLGHFVYDYSGAPPPPPPPPPPGGGGGGGGGCNQSAPVDAPVSGGPIGCLTNSRPTFSWSPVASARDYKVAVFEVTADGNDPLLYFDAVLGTSFRLPFDLAPEKRYRWKVKARNCAGDGQYSEIKYFTLAAVCMPPSVAPVPGAPKGCVDLVRPAFTWSAVPGATGYRIVVSPADHDDFFIDQVVQAPATSLASPVALNPRTEYRFKVRAVNDTGPGPWSAITYFTPFCSGVSSAITAPLGCTSTGTPVFTWTAIAPAIQYWLIVANSNDFSAPATTWFINVHLTGTSYATPPGVVFAPGATYYAKIKTLLDPSSTTAAAWSPVISFTPLCPNRPPTVQLSVTGDGCHVPCSASFKATAADANGNLLSYQWSGCTSSLTDGPIATCLMTTAGPVQATVTVSDGAGGSASANATASGANQAPMVYIEGPASCIAPCTVDLVAPASDADGDALTYSWTGCTAGTGSKATCTIGAAGTFTAIVAVSDGRGPATVAQYSVAPQ